MANNYSGEEFLDKLYRDLYMSDEVQHTKENKDKRLETIKKYMDRLERIHSKADTDGKKNLLYGRYIDKYVIKKENIRTKEKMEIERIQNAQKKTLMMWLEYLSNPTAVYPTWAKYWAFQGMLKMGSYDDIKGVYLKRDKKTEAPFVDCNPEIIAKCITTIMKLVNKEEITEDIEEKLSKTDSFSKIYTLFEKQYKKSVADRTSTEGIWIKYNQGSKEDAIKLAKSLEGKNTGWCTASEDMAIKQVCGPYESAYRGGDFYVYYTKDKDDNYSVPRIAIRLDGHNNIGEIRGVEDGQNLEESMIGVLENKLKKMTFLSSDDVKNALETVEALKVFTIIRRKTENKEPLTKEEINILYTKTFGFGWTQDPRAYEIIIHKRNVLEDYGNCNSDAKKSIIDEYMNQISDQTDKISIKELLKIHPELVIALVKYSIFQFKRVDKEIQKEHPEIVMAAVEGDGKAIEYVDKEILKSHPEIVMAALNQDERAIFYVDKEIQEEHIDILKRSVGLHYGLQFVDKEMQKEHPEIVREAVWYYGDAIKYVDKELQKAHPDIVVLAINSMVNNLERDYERFAQDHPYYFSNDVEEYEDALECIDSDVLEECSEDISIKLSIADSLIKKFKKQSMK